MMLLVVTRLVPDPRVVDIRSDDSDSVPTFDEFTSKEILVHE
jgi:hypothetical protein